MTNDKSPTPAVERTMGMCCAACTPSHKTPHVEQKICVDWKPLAPSDSQGTKPDEKCAINMCVYPSVILCDLLKGHEGMHSATIASYPAPLLNSVDTPAPVPERTNGELNERSIRCESGGSISVDSLRAVGVGDVLQVAAPVPEPEGEILESSTRKDEGAIVSGTASSGEFVEPPARKDELGTCQHNDLPHIKWGCCDDWTPVAPQASPEHDLRKQDTPESKEHWDFVAEATARVEAMPEWKKNSVAVGGSPEAPAKEDAMADFRSWYTQEGSAKFDEISQRHYEPDDCTDTQLIMQEVAELTWARARLGLSGRAE